MIKELTQIQLNALIDTYKSYCDLSESYVLSIFQNQFNLHHREGKYYVEGNLIDLLHYNLEYYSNLKTMHDRGGMLTSFMETVKYLTTINNPY